MVLCWNARGLGNPRAFCALFDLVWVRCPQILFLSETKCGDEIASKLKKMGRFSSYLTVKSSRIKGGLCLL